MSTQSGIAEGLYYQIEGSGRPILIVHGWSLDHRAMKGCLEPVFTKSPGWKRIYVDLPGMGQSAASDHIRTADDLLSILLRFVDQVIGDEPFAVCGGSYGGYMARGVVHERFNRILGIMLMSPVVLPNRADRTLPERKVVYVDGALMDELSTADAESFKSLVVVQGRSEWVRFRDEVLVGLRKADKKLLERVSTLGYGCSFNVDDLPEPLDKPALIVTGRLDASVGFVDALRLLDRYPRATYVALDRAGHNLQIEQPDLFEALVEEWLSRLQESLTS